MPDTISLDLREQIAAIQQRRNELLVKLDTLDSALEHLEKASDVLTESGKARPPSADDLRAALTALGGEADVSSITEFLAIPDGRVLTGARVAGKREGWLEVNDGIYRLVDAA